MTRAPIFDAIRAARNGASFTQAEVARIDAMLDSLSITATQNAGTDIPDDYWPMLSRIESGDRPYVKASTSSASGLYQFIRGTWIGEGGKWGPNNAAAFGGLTPPASEQLARAKTFTEKNAKFLRSRGVTINKASLYAAHFLGVGTAATVLAAPRNADAGKLAGDAATSANPSILRGKTVQQFLDWLNKKTGDHAL